MSTFYGKLVNSSTRLLTCFKLFNKMSQSTECKKICTHNGVFHCDDVLACYLLKKLPEYSNSPIIRTRDPAVIESSDIVVDVGGVYDHAKHRYDHHQREFNATLHDLDQRKPFDIKLSSAGLIYHHYGRQIITRLLESAGLVQSGDAHQIEILFDVIYEKFIREIDAIDNGVSICEGKPKYTIHSDLSSRVAHLRPNWNEEASDEILYERFQQAIQLVGHEFEDRVNYFSKFWYPAKKFVRDAVLDRMNVHPSGTMIDLSAYGGLPWKEHLFDVEKEMNIEGEIKFTLFQDVKKVWRIQCVPILPHSFVLRLPLYTEWRGLRDDELSKISGIPGCIFVHANSFIGGAKSRESCIALAEKTISLTARPKNE